MLQNGHPITQETFHYLLISCVNDKQHGFRLALQVLAHIYGLETHIRIGAPKIVF